MNNKKFIYFLILTYNVSDKKIHLHHHFLQKMKHIVKGEMFSLLHSQRAMATVSDDGDDVWRRDDEVGVEGKCNGLYFGGMISRLILLFLLNF